MPWIVIGDFNMNFNQSEELGGLPFNKTNSAYYANILEISGLYGLGYSDNDYIWDNHREGNQNIHERLDIAVINDKWHTHFPYAYLPHLVAVGCPILLTLDSQISKSEWVFKFYDIWLKDLSCLQVIQGSWNAIYEMKASSRLVHNLK
ncbi:uncharacterized protein LOC113273160 [Papaver somniferum]|uniref:uncharacterized protein LOC113273160 n=1 Tax=Papaver somniferum TaxID=3469 RepID=UPI000E6FBD03|nr:uncharacterized protein LOC113273160 [Papaver somniferum]